MTDRRKLSRWGTLAVLLALSSSGNALAADDDTKARAKSHYDRGVIEYNLGRFEAAIAELSKAYELDPEPILLFNIAQAHRKLGNSDQAIFFYQRYLASGLPPARADEVKRRITELEARKQAERAAKAQPVVPEPPPPSPPAPVNPAPASSPVPSVDTAATGATRTSSDATLLLDRFLELSLSAGVAQALFPSGEFSRPTVPAGEIGLLYGTQGPVVAFAGGLSIPYLRISYTSDASTGASQVFGPMLTGAIGWRPTGVIELRGQVAAGMLWWTGLGTLNPFREGEGTLALGAVRLSAEARWQPSGRAFLGLGPSYLVTTSSDTFAGTLSRLTAWGLLARVGTQL
jgi:Tetratricopeptide repeat